MYMQHFLDFRTLLACESLLAMVLAFVFLGLQRVFPQVRGARPIAISFLLVVPDAIAVGLRGHVSPLVSVLIADTLLLGSLIAMYEAVVQFTGAANRRWLLWFAAFVSFAVVYFYTDVRPAVAPRVISIALAVSFVRGNTALALLRRSMRSSQRLTLAFFGLFMAGLTGVSVYRAVRTVIYGVPLEPLRQDAILSSNLVVGIFSLAVCGLCFLRLASRELAPRRRMEADWAPLPGMFDRRGLEVNLALELERFQERFEERQQVFSIALVEIDRLNEAENSSDRKRTMRDVAATISGELRSTDHIGRFTQNQFLLFFAQTGHSEALVVAERCAAEVARLNFRYDVGKITLSMGITESLQGDTIAGLILRAECGLKQAQADGGNCRSVALTERPDNSAGAAKRVSAVA
jgi:diguanylate cyclase (GGDEF)-like protein